jgi:hypothetical protein
MSLLILAMCSFQTPSDLAAQFAEPCQLTCAAVLGATGFVTATGTAIAVGRVSGGLSTVSQGLWIWGGTLAAVAGGGMALSGDGPRQERAIYAAGIGTVAGALSGLALGAVGARDDPPRMLASTLVGAAVGAVVGGVYGALTHDDAPSSGSVPLFALHLPL